MLLSEEGTIPFYFSQVIQEDIKCASSVLGPTKRSRGKVMEKLSPDITHNRSQMILHLQQLSSRDSASIPRWDPPSNPTHKAPKCASRALPLDQWFSTSGSVSLLRDALRGRILSSSSRLYSLDTQ